ncbi:MAG: MBOAT family protein [Lachnospiraceae bacterium]|nr:MBOAT family protein [Lachnospiraceae bacterium]
MESLVFYAYGALRYLPLLLLLIPINYTTARVIGKMKEGARRKWMLGIGVFLNVCPVVVFKYGEYLSELIARIGHGQLELPDLIPLGISYYTFKSVSYLCDVYRRECEPETNLIDLAVYVMMYQQMIVGPIIRYTDIRDTLKKTGPRADAGQCAEGVRMFIYGLAKKVLLADSLAGMWQEFSLRDGIGLERASSGLVWFAVLCYSLQLYLDFSGYSEMSNGLSKIMGFDCKDNFADPYCATSVTQFWRRWHITLTEWFRDYVYIPLGGNRKGNVRQAVNMLIVWILTGMWHGASVNFLIWGGYYFLILLAEKKLIGKSKGHPVIGRIYTLFVAVLGWGIFAASGQVSLPVLLSKLFGFSGGISALYFVRNYGVAFLLSVFVSGGFVRRIREKLAWPVWVDHVTTLFLLLISFAYIVGSTGNAAMYAVF